MAMAQTVFRTRQAFYRRSTVAARWTQRAKMPLFQAFLRPSPSKVTDGFCIKDATTIEPAMGSAAFLNEAINQLAEAYLDKKQKETGRLIAAQDRVQELQKVKMFIADRNVYGIDLNPVAVELAEVSMWLNTIYAGGFVPWFGNQLVNGNSLIGARRQVYRVSQLTATSKGLRWYENAPERVPVGTPRVEQRNSVSKRQVYHFLLGDPGMASYSDKVIKKLEPDAIKALNKWNKEFNEPYSDDEIHTLLYLSSVIDDLWMKQIELRKTIEEDTRDNLSVFGYDDTVTDSHTSIRQKDEIYSKLYKNEHMRNAGPYARLKFAMDYWCSLWFWPINEEELLPSRSEFLNDMSLILEGTFTTQKGVNLLEYQQLSLFPSEQDELILKISELFPGQSVVDLDNLCSLFPRLALVRKLSEENHFMHWELEFADLFAERKGFDLFVGNPPWIKLEWNEQSVLADRQPMFAVKKLTATQTTHHRDEALVNTATHTLYFSEYESTSGQQSFLGAVQNYADIMGSVNLYKCFLPLAWMFNNESGVAAFVHPDGVYNDSKGGSLRKVLYKKLKYHFQLENELNLFEGTNDHGRMRFALNVYKNGQQEVKFDTISNLFLPTTIDLCYEGDTSMPIPGIKDENGEWNITGHPDRIIRVSKKELKLFAKLFDLSDDWMSAKMPVLHVRQFVDVLERFASQESTLGNIISDVFASEMWNETGAQKDGTIQRNVHFPEDYYDMIYSGSHTNVANPLFKSSRRICLNNSDFDYIDLTNLPETYLQRCNYSILTDRETYIGRAPVTGWGENYLNTYRLISRRMLNQSGERTLTWQPLPDVKQAYHMIFLSNAQANQIYI